MISKSQLKKLLLPSVPNGQRFTPKIRVLVPTGIAIVGEVYSLGSGYYDGNYYTCEITPHNSRITSIDSSIEYTVSGGA
jgi:hypothetical protein